MVNQNKKLSNQSILFAATLGIDPSKPMNQQRREKLHLALQWNRSDIAKNYIMKDVTQWNV